MEDADDQFLAHETVELYAVLHDAGDPGRPGEDQQAADAFLRKLEAGLGDLLQDAAGDGAGLEPENDQGADPLQELPDFGLEHDDDQEKGNTQEILQNLAGEEQPAPIRDAVQDAQDAQADQDMVRAGPLQPHVEAVDQGRYDENIKQVDQIEHRSGFPRRRLCNVFLTWTVSIYYYSL